MSEEINLIQFYLKCQNVETGDLATYRFSHQDELLLFSKTLSDKKLAIVDTHIAFFDIDLLFNPFDDGYHPIHAGEINTAKNGIQELE